MNLEPNSIQKLAHEVKIVLDQVSRLTTNSSTIVRLLTSPTCSGLPSSKCPTGECLLPCARHNPLQLKPSQNRTVN
uniref:Putative ovule protein n=1 Tax=Solanum chacoense TaxID=4108 RepID=A0A0V0HPM1_SOLCH